MTLNSASPTATVTMTIATTGAATAANRNAAGYGGTFGGIAAFFSVSFACFALRPGKRRSARSALLGVVLLGLSGCGGNSGPHSTPAGSTNAVVTFSSGGVTHALVFTVNVH